MTSSSRWKTLGKLISLSNSKIKFNCLQMTIDKRNKGLMTWIAIIIYDISIIQTATLCTSVLCTLHNTSMDLDDYSHCQMEKTHSPVFLATIAGQTLSLFTKPSLTIPSTVNKASCRLSNKVLHYSSYHILHTSKSKIPNIYPVLD